MKYTVCIYDAQFNILCKSEEFTSKHQAIRFYHSNDIDLAACVFEEEIKENMTVQRVILERQYGDNDPFI